MTTNDIAVAQEALAYLREEVTLTANTPSAPSTKTERAVRRMFDTSRRAFLASHDWNFAKARSAYSATKPSAALRVLAVTDADGRAVKWRLVGSSLVSPDTGAAYVEYTQDVADTSTWPPLARSAFALFLARELCMVVTGRQDDLKAVDALMKERVSEARLADLKEGEPADERAAEIIALLREAPGLAQDAELDGVETVTRRLETLIDAATAEVTASHDWASGAGEYDDLPPLAQAAVIALAAHKAAGRVGAGAEATKALWELYEEKLLKARLKDLHEKQAANDDPVLAELMANFSGDDAALPHLYDVYSARRDAVGKAVEGEVRKTLGIASNAALDDLAKAICHALVTSRLAVSCGLDANYAQLKSQEYAAKVQEWRKIALNTALASNTDEVLTELLANFASDDAGLLNAFTVYTQRSANIKATSAIEINNAHKWTTVFAQNATTHKAYPAFVALCVARLAMACGIDGQTRTSLSQIYEQRLHRAKAMELEGELTDSLDREILATIKGGVGDSLPLSFGATELASIKATVLDSLLYSHHWNFARKTEAFATTRPSDCIRILRVTDSEGRRVAWETKGSTISADASAATLEYTARIQIASWPALAKSAYIAAVASEMAQKTAPSGEAALAAKNALAQLADKRLAAAKVADLNENGSGDELVREVKNVLKAEYRATDADLDESSDALALRIAELTEGARGEVMTAHNWSFARETLGVCATERTDLGGFVVPRPFGIAKITGVRTHGGDLCAWTVQGEWIVAREPIGSITYIRDVKDVSEWPQNVRRALIYRIAADAATTLPHRDKDPSLMLELYRQKLQAAAASDAREANPGHTAWGHGSFLRAMRGERKS